MLLPTAILMYEGDVCMQNSIVAFRLIYIPLQVYEHFSSAEYSQRVQHQVALFSTAKITHMLSCTIANIKHVFPCLPAVTH